MTRYDDCKKRVEHLDNLILQLDKTREQLVQQRDDYQNEIYENEAEYQDSAIVDMPEGRGWKA